MKQKIKGGRIHFVYHDRKIKVVPVTEDELKSPDKFIKGFLCGMLTCVVCFLLGWVMRGII